jgi:uncharacterized protein YcbX
MTATARVASLHRYPVKSMLGESLAHLDVDERGVTGDRRWSVRTPENKMGSGKSSTRFDAVVGLLDLRAAVDDGGGVAVSFPDGSVHRVDDPLAAERLSALLGRPLTFAAETDVSHFDDGPVSIIARASVQALADARGEAVDARRFRANIALDTDVAFVEDEWIGRRVRIGSAVLEVVLPSPRCVMINMASADLGAQPGNLAALGRLHDGCLGVIARVVTPGGITTGDELTVL